MSTTNRRNFLRAGAAASIAGAIAPALAVPAGVDLDREVTGGGAFEVGRQLGDPGFECGDVLEEFPAAGTRGLVHAGRVGTRTAISSP